MNRISSITTPLFNFFEAKTPRVVDCMTWVFFRLALLWDPNQREEYYQFFEIKRLSMMTNTPEMIRVFKTKVLALSNKISDESIIQHIKRLNSGDLSNQPYFDRVGDEKTCIKAHEIFEMLSMKWEKGIPVYKDRFSAFWPAHRQAIRVENIFLQALALEKGLPLSKDVMEYCRICDEHYLEFPIRFSSLSLDLEETEKNLTKNLEAMPSHPNEIDDFCKFFSQFMNHWSPRIRIGLCQRYLFSTLFRDYPDKKSYLIALLRALEKDEIYNKYPLETIVAKLKYHLHNFSLPLYWSEQSILQADHFFCKDANHLPFTIHEAYKCLKDSFDL